MPMGYCVRAVLPLADQHMHCAKRQDATYFTSSGDRPLELYE